MPTVQAVGVITEERLPFQLPLLANRSGVAARLAAIETMEVDDPSRATPAAGSVANAGTAAPQPGPVRASVAVPARVRILGPSGAGPLGNVAPGGGTAASVVSYTADDWRGHIRGAQARASARTYGMSPGAVPTAGLVRPDPDYPGLDPLPAARTRSESPVSSKSEESAGGENPTKPASRLDQLARIGVVVILLAMLVALFVYGPQFSRWWGSL